MSKLAGMGKFLVDIRPLFRLQALRQLIENFDEIDAMEPETGGADPMVDMRVRIILQVSAIARFLQALPELFGHEKGLMTLAESLHDVNENRRNALLKPAKEEKGGRRRGGHTEAFERARAAAAMELFIKAKEPNESAARLVARTPIVSASWKQVRDWREHAMGRAEADGPLIRHYRDLLAIFEALDADPRRAAKALLEG